MTQISRINSADAARWRQGWLGYRNEPLRYVVADLSRYSNVRIELAAAAANIRFSGALNRDNITEWIAALPEVAAVTVVPTTSGYSIDPRVQ